MLGNFANTDQNLLKEGFALRLRNPRFNCFLNTALNSVISNELLLNRILNPSIEISGELRVLFEHLDIENIGEFSNENLISLLEFHCYDTDGCAKVHGDECFSVIKKNLKERIAELKIIDEIKFLALREGINETLKLRGLLSQRFSGFSADIQYDAGEAFLCILQCLWGAEKLCSLRLVRTRICKSCNDISTTSLSEECSIMLNRVGRISIPLQDAISEWSKEHTLLSYQCECKLRDGVWTNPELYYTTHIDSFVIENAPEFLHIKVRDMSVMESGIKVRTSFSFK